MADQATFRIWRGDKRQRQVRRLHHGISKRAWWCWTRCTAFRQTQANDMAVRWNCKAGKCGSCSAEINGKPRLMCMTRLNSSGSDAAGDGRADEDVPACQGSGHGRLLELPRQEEDPEVQAAQAGRCRRNVARAAGRRRPPAGIPQVHRVFPVPGRVPRAARSRPARRVHRAAVPDLYGAAGDESARYRRPAARRSRTSYGIGYCNITKCCTKVCPEEIKITDNAIIPLKERVVDEFFDPIARLFGSGK